MEDISWTAAEKQEINDMLGLARYKERMKQMRAQRAGKTRMVAKKNKLAQDERVTKLYDVDAPAKAKVQRAKRNKQAKNASVEAKKRVFETGQGDEKVMFHLDDDGITEAQSTSPDAHDK